MSLPYAIRTENSEAFEVRQRPNYSSNSREIFRFGIATSMAQCALQIRAKRWAFRIFDELYITVRGKRKINLEIRSVTSQDVYSALIYAYTSGHLLACEFSAHFRAAFLVEHRPD